MKAIVLAGGKGERLGPAFQNTPKSMIQIGEKPVLHCIVDQLRAAGVTEVILHVSHLANVIRGYFGDGSDFGVRITYSQTGEWWGTAGTVKIRQAELAEAPFYVVYGDCYSNYELDELRRAHQSFKKHHPELLGTIGAWIREEDVVQAGILTVDKEHRIVRFKEKPKPEEVFSNLVNTALYFVEPELLDRIPENQYKDFAYDIFPDLAHERLLCATELTGWYRPYDTIQLLELAKRLASSQ